jgi:putative peptide zinc metalloprotease protein
VLVTLVGLVLVAAATVPLVVLAPDDGNAPVPGPAWLVLLPLMALANAVHEGTHALVCRLLGLGVEEVGIALWWWCIPFCYVEHRGVPRLPARADHVVVALVGPAAHLVLAAGAAALALATQGTPTGTLAATASGLLAAAALFNLNPALPTDGYRALEAATGQVGFRAAAVNTLATTWLGTPRQGQARGRGARTAHWAYLLFCLGWLAVLAVTLVSATATAMDTAPLLP